jgi:uncharacterized protein (DUF1684 family)
MTENLYLKEINQIRENLDYFFKSSADSPLTMQQKQSFTGLSYFPVNQKLNFSVNLQQYEDPEEITILATKGDERRYLRFGYFEFYHKNTKHRLTVFKHVDDDYLFIPFKDKTSGKESYGGGRYIDLEPSNEGLYRIDFNLAYLPYCAFNDGYSCTLVPPENFLEVPIHAGQKNFP